MSVDEIKAIIDAAPLEEQVLLRSYLNRKFAIDPTLSLPEKLAAANRRMDAGQFVTLEQVKEICRKIDTWLPEQ